jgi:hypothetical protein
MDEFNTKFAIDDLIIKGNIEIKTIHLLSENDQFIIAVSWIECDEAHFKMFKNQDISNIKSICDFLLDYDQSWYNLVQNWIAKP